MTGREIAPSLATPEGKKAAEIVREWLGRPTFTSKDFDLVHAIASALTAGWEAGPGTSPNSDTYRAMKVRVNALELENERLRAQPGWEAGREATLAALQNHLTDLRDSYLFEDHEQSGFDALHRAIEVVRALVPPEGGQGGMAAELSTVEAICRAVCKVEGIDPDEPLTEYETEAHGYRETDPRWTRYADAVMHAMQSAPPEDKQGGEG